VERVDDGALDLDLLVDDPRCEQLTDARRLEERCLILAGVEHPLPAVAARGHRQRDDRPRGVADEVRVRRLGHGTVDERVDNQPALREREAAEGDLQAAADRAAPAVAADQVARAQLLRASAADRAHPRAHVLRTPVDRLDAVSPAQLHARAVLQRGDHRALHRGLVDRHERRVA